MADYDYNIGDYNVSITDYNITDTRDPLPVFGSIQIVVTSLFSLISFVGNVLILKMIATSKSLQTIPYYYLVSMALGDILIALSTPTSVTTFFLRTYIFGSVMCKIMSCVIQTGIYLNNLFLIFLCVDCYLMCRKRTSAYRMKVLKILTGVTWVLGLLGCVTIYRDTQYRDDSYYGKVCFESPLYHSIEPVINALSLIFTFYIPFIIILVYVSLIYNFRKLPGNDNQNIQHCVFVIAVSVAFSCCQFPYWTQRFISIFFSINSLIFHNDIFYLFVPLIATNIALNAILVIHYSPEMKSKVFFWRKEYVPPPALHDMAPL